MAAAVMLGAALPAAAQDARAAGQACAQIADSLERLRCYDLEFRPTPSAEEGRLPPAPAATTSSAVPSAPAAAAPAAAPIAAAPTVAAPPAAAPAAAPAASAAPAPAADRFAAEEPVPIVVVAISELRGGDSRFTTEDGQLWIQTDGRRNIYPDLPFPAVIRPGAMGSAFLVPENGRGVRVRRGP
jgi:hypothetical protein